MIAINQPEHLSDQDLRDVVSGKNPTGRFEQLMEHLDQCESCQSRASQSLSSDSLADALAAGHLAGDDAVLAEADCHAALFHAAGAGLGTGAMRLDAVLPPVEMLGAYRLLRPIGRGGMGAVYLAQHERLKKRCAIKLLPRQHGFDAAWVQRFEREMQAVASLSHAGIVAATDAGDIGGWHYLVMEYLDGLDLAAIGRRIGPVDVPVAAAIMRDVCDALAAVHQAGLVHRDIKPSNIMLTRDGTTKLLDLGLVLDQKQSLADMRLTTVGHVIGTLAFAAPEQLSDGSAVDGRADLYGVGATLFQLIAGQPAHRSDRGVAPLVIDKTTNPARRLSELVPDVPASIDSLVASLLQRDPAQRPDSAAEVAARLEEVAVPNGNRSAAAKSLVARAMRITDTQSSISNSLALPVSADAQQLPSRNWLKWLAAGGLPAAIVVAVATIVIIIQQGKSQVRIETSDPAIAIRVEESGENIAISQTESAIGSTEKIFKGKTLGYWTNLLAIERDSDTLREAMTAVANLTDKGDVAAAHALLKAVSRDVSDVENRAEAPALNDIVETFSQVMPDPGIDAIAKELATGNQKSRAVSLYIIQRYATSRKYQSESPLQKWAALPENKASAARLHDEIRKLLQAGSLDDSNHKHGARQTSLLLALTLDRPLQEEPELRQTIEQAIAKSKTEKSGKEKLELEASGNWMPQVTDGTLGGFGAEGMGGEMGGMGAGMMGPDTRFPWLTYLTPAETLAADRLGIVLPPHLLTSSIFTREFSLRDELQNILLNHLKSSPTQFADEIAFTMWTRLPYLSWMISPDQRDDRTTDAIVQFWTQALPLVQAHTSQPQLLADALAQIDLLQPGGMGGGMGGMGGYGGMGAGEIPKPLADAIRQAHESAKQRVSAPEP
jgi:serine/threonine protein kinase